MLLSIATKEKPIQKFLAHRAHGFMSLLTCPVSSVMHAHVYMVKAAQAIAAQVRLLFTAYSYFIADSQASCK
jgi:hypothetical protein